MFERINDRLMNVASFGTGTPMLLVGGWIGPWQVWRQTMELWSAEYRCVAYDHRGAGQTVTEPAELTFEGMVDDVFAVLDHLGIERCWLGGESQGGIVACAASLRDPSRFLGQFLVATGPEVVVGEAEHRFADMLDSPDHADAALDGFVDLVITEPDAGHYKRWLRSMLDEADPSAGATILRSFDGTSITAELADVSIPTLVVHGTDDRVMSPAAAEHMAAAIANSQLELLEGVGHVPTITRPERTARVVTDFIRTHT